MRIPNVGSYIKVRVKYSQGAQMIPKQDSFKLYEGKVLPSYKWLSDRQFCLSGDKNFPIRVIDMTYVEDLNIVEGTFTEVDTGVKTYTVTGSKGDKYVVTRNGKGWSCTCVGFQFKRQCKHVNELSKEKV